MRARAKTRIGALLFSFAYIVNADEAQMLKHVDELQWENRLILVDAEDDSEDLVSALKSRTAEIDERHILWFVISDNRVTSNFPGKIERTFPRSLAEKYPIQPGNVALIGKDAGVKSRSRRLDIDAIFRQIDSMPMRIQEMRNN
ncbi:MAG: DUF4174 domain-containing protein [Opitutales bacterium]